MAGGFVCSVFSYWSTGMSANQPSIAESTYRTSTATCDVKTGWTTEV